VPYSSQSPVGDANLELGARFNALFDEARTIGRITKPHPMLRMPLDIIRYIFEVATRSDPDVPALLAETCQEWRDLVLETSALWSTIKVVTDDEDALEALRLALLLSRNQPLDIVLTGVRAPRELPDVLVPHIGRIRSLEIQLYEQGREPFRVLGRASPDAFRRLSRFSVEDALYNLMPEETLKGSALHPLERARRHENALDEVDLKLIQSLPMLSSLTALVINDVSMTTIAPLQLPSVKSLRLLMKDTPLLLQTLTCHLLETLDLVIDDLSREGWWDVLCTSLAYPRLESLAVDVTLARSKDDWSKPWSAQELPRLPTHNCLSKIIVTLAFADRKYEGLNEDPEHLCGDMLEGLIASAPLLTDLRLLHVPFFHAPFIWPMPQIMQSLRRLELQVPAIVDDLHSPVIVLPNLRDLRYYGHITPETTQLPTLRTPFLEYLEIMHHEWSIHPVLIQVDRQWLNTPREPIKYQNYGVFRKNSSKDFPLWDELPHPEGADRLFPVIHQSTALRELRLHLGDVHNRGPEFMETQFPNLRVLYCSVPHLFMIGAPQLMELHLIWFPRDEPKNFNAYPEAARSQHTLRYIRLLDIYSHTDLRYHEGSPCTGLYLREWVVYLDALETIVLPQLGHLMEQFTELLSKNPQICPQLTTIDSFGYPQSWIAFRDCLEGRNHLAMQVHHIQAIHTLRFPLALHRNITDRLKEVLSGQFSARFEAIPLQPWAIAELIPPSEREKAGRRPDHICFGCLQSGNAFRCSGPIRVHPFQTIDCRRHMSRRPDRGVTISAYIMNIAGYVG